MGQGGEVFGGEGGLRGRDGVLQRWTTADLQVRKRPGLYAIQGGGETRRRLYMAEGPQSGMFTASVISS
jgi:hypothetical protein